MDRASYALRPVDWMENITPRVYAWEGELGEQRIRYAWLPADASTPLSL